MTSTSQDNPAKDAPGSSPDKAAEAPKEARQVPLDALAEARQKAREALDKAAQLEAELTRLKNGDGKAAAPAPAADQKIAEKLQQWERKERIRDLTVELGLVDTKQAETIVGLLDKNSDLTATEALEIASKRHPDMFKERGQPGFHPGIHGSLRPTPGSAPVEEPKSDHKQRMEYVRKLDGKDKRQMHAIVNNMIGAAAAKAMGWGHHKLQIPKN